MQTTRAFSHPGFFFLETPSVVYAFADSRLRVELGWLEDARHSCRSLQGMTMNCTRVAPDTGM